jgi:predicted amidohydrolase
MKIRLWQLDVSESEPADIRLSRVQQALPELISGTDLLVMPELWIPGAFALADLNSNEISLSHDFFVSAQRVVNSTGATAHLGSFPIRGENQKLYNTSVVLQPHQNPTTYRKQHLFGFEDGERLFLEASNDVVLLQTPLGTTALATCYDLRFPEMFRQLLDEGAESYVIPAGWPTSRINHWKVLLQARAIENQAIVVGVNSVGVSGGVALGGNSMVISANGEIVAEAADNECVMDVQVDTSAGTNLRMTFPVLNDRRNK